MPSPTATLLIFPRIHPFSSLLPSTPQIYTMTDPSSADNFFFIIGLLAVNIIGIGLIIELICFGKGDVESIRNYSKVKLILEDLPGTAFFVAAAAFFVAGASLALVPAAHLALLLHLLRDQELVARRHLRLRLRGHGPWGVASAP